MRPMVKKLCEHCLEDNDIYFVKTEHDKIFINDNYQVIQLAVARKHGRFPNLAFLDFAVSG